MRLAPRNNACAADHGAMWIMLMQITASAAAIGHCAAATSRKRGCRRLVCAATATHAEIERRQASSCSLGCQISCGITCAKWTTCSPVPLPTSSTTPDGGRTCASTTAIGSLLRAAEGLASRPSSEAFRSSSRMPYRNLFERQHHRPGYRISNADATAEVFQSVAEGIERCDHLRPRIPECIHVRPLGDDAIRAFPGLDYVHMTQARHVASMFLWASRNSCSRPGFTRKRTALKAVTVHLLLWMDYLTPSLCSCRQTGARPPETGSPVRATIGIATIASLRGWAIMSAIARMMSGPLCTT